MRAKVRLSQTFLEFPSLCWYREQLNVNCCILSADAIPFSEAQSLFLMYSASILYKFVLNLFELDLLFWNVCLIVYADFARSLAAWRLETGKHGIHSVFAKYSHYVPYCSGERSVWGVWSANAVGNVQSKFLPYKKYHLNCPKVDWFCLLIASQRS